MLMKNPFILICFSFLLQNVHSQNKKDLVLSFNDDVSNSPYYKNSRIGEFYKAGAEHFLSKSNSLSFDFPGARHWYYDDILSDKNAAESTHVRAILILTLLLTQSFQFLINTN